MSVLTPTVMREMHLWICTLKLPYNQRNLDKVKWMPKTSFTIILNQVLQMKTMTLVSMQLLDRIGRLCPKKTVIFWII